MGMTLENTWYEADDDRCTNLEVHHDYVDESTGDCYTDTAVVAGTVKPGTRVYLRDDEDGRFFIV